MKKNKRGRKRVQNKPSTNGVDCKEEQIKHRMLKINFIICILKEFKFSPGWTEGLHYMYKIIILNIKYGKYKLAQKFKFWMNKTNWICFLNDRSK